MEETFYFESREKYIEALNSVLPEDYIQKRTIPNGTIEYIPAPIKEATADKFFHYWNVIGEDYTLLVNELICTVKLVFMPDYPGAEEHFCTGSAAVPVQMDRGASVAKFPAGKKTNALEYNLPAVRTEAIGNALNSLGNIFGRSLGRKINARQKLPRDFKL